MPKRFRKPASSPTKRKSRKTFTLSRETVHFIEAEKHKRGRDSASAVLEEIIRECRCKQDTSKIDAAISTYYDSLSDEERAEDKRWGEFAESQFPVD